MLQRTRGSSLPIHLKAILEEQDFPCVGAKSALANDQIEWIEVGDMRCAEEDAMIAAALQDFAGHHGESSLFVSFAVLFRAPTHLDEEAFERALWIRLQALHEIDRHEFGWDGAVSADPASPHFSMSIGGCGFYVIGLHPNASRFARRLPRPALIFNLHRQFEELRSDGRYDQMRKTIVERDVALQGFENPMLSVHGSDSEARQYSGRRVEQDWECPFRPVHDDD